MRRKLTAIQEQNLLDLYNNGDTLQVLAKKFGVTAMTARAAILRSGGQLRRRGKVDKPYTEDQCSEILRRYSEGYTIVSIARAMSTHVTKVTDLLVEAGVVERFTRQPRPVGRRIRDNHGYWRVKLAPDDEMIDMAWQNGLVSEHRLVMARSLGRPLHSSETVHHIDGDRENNDLSNLQLRQGPHGRGAVVRCLDCGSHNLGSAELPD